MIGQTISHYRIISKLGEGGMGVVYKAQDLKLDRVVALKFLPAGSALDSEERTRFELEAKAVSHLNHPHIATVHDVGESDGRHFIVFEYIEGGTLKQKIQQEQLSVPLCIDYATQIAAGLAHAHKHGVVHRDLKTDNIMFTGDGEIKITDFGLARMADTSKLTRTGSTIGTAAYMSPEQALGEAADERSDIFSLGVILYEMITGELPFKGQNTPALMYGIVNTAHKPLREERADVSPELETIVSRALEKDADKRYQLAKDLLADLTALKQQIGSGNGKGVRTIRHVDTRKVLRVAIPTFVGFLALAVAVVYFLIPTRSSSRDRRSVVVLPLKNMSNDPEQEYFSDGITDDIINSLAKIADFKVISRTSAMHYKNTNKTAREIAGELNVATVLEGSVRRAGNQIRIVANLVDGNTEQNLWTLTYDKDLTQIFAIQSDVAQRIATALRAKLSQADKDRIERSQTENPEAYQLYLKGRFHWNKRRANDIKKALENFNQAIEIDSGYALAYAGLASTYLLLPDFILIDPEQCIEKARSFALRSLDLDSAHAEPHTVLALISDYDLDWAKAESHYRRAIDLDPSYPTAYQWYHVHLRTLGRFDEALSEIKRAEELDPLSLIISENVGELLYLMRRYDEAMKQDKKTIELDPNFPWAHGCLAGVYVKRGDLVNAIEEFQKARTLAGSEIGGLADMGYVYGRAGRENDATSALNMLIDYSSRGNAVAYDIAKVYYGKGDKDKTFEWLERAYQERKFLLVGMRVDPFWDDLRSDPRFTALMKKVWSEK